MYPVSFAADYVERRSRLTTFFRIILAIPHIIVLYVYGIVAYIGVIIAWFAIVITGRYPEGLYNFVAGFVRYATQVIAYVTLLTDVYPPFGPGGVDYPIRMTFAGPLPQYSRLKTFFRFILAIPLVVLRYVARDPAGVRRAVRLVRDRDHRQDAARAPGRDGAGVVIHGTERQLPLPHHRDLSPVPRGHRRRHDRLDGYPAGHALGIESWRRPSCHRLRRGTMKRALTLGATLAMGLTIWAGTAAAAPSIHPTRYYLALGDSLSVGFQPNANGTGLETDRGYTNDLLTLESKHAKNLVLVEVGCPGDTTTSLLTGQGNATNAAKYHCNRRKGSQLKAAVAFLKQHHAAGEVPLITIDIGANDVDGCVSAGSIAAISACIATGENAIKQNTPKILNALKAAAPKGTRFAAMNLYDPVLGEYFSTSSSDKTLASASVPLVQGLNSDIQSADSSSGFKTADVADAFQTYNTAATVSFDGQMVPVDVATVCGLTWACTPPPVGPNIHANDNGYSVIAQAFYSTVGRLH